MKFKCDVCGYEWEGEKKDMPKNCLVCGAITKEHWKKQ